MNIDNKCYHKHKLSQHKLSYLQGYTPSETFSLGLDSVNGTGTQLPRKFNRKIQLWGLSSHITFKSCIA